MYPRYSSGLAEYTSEGLFRCKDLMSSGGDVDFSVAYLVLMLVPLSLRVLWWRRGPGGAEALVFWTSFWFSIFLAFFLADCGSIIDTLFYGGDFLLISILIALMSSVVSFSILRIR